MHFTQHMFNPSGSTTLMLEVTTPQVDRIKDTLKTRMNPALSLQQTGRGGRAMPGTPLQPQQASACAYRHWAPLTHPFPSLATWPQTGRAWGWLNFYNEWNSLTPNPSGARKFHWQCSGDEGRQASSSPRHPARHPHRASTRGTAAPKCSGKFLSVGGMCWRKWPSTLCRSGYNLKLKK